MRTLIIFVLHAVNDCGQDPAAPVNGNVLTSGTTFGSRAIYFCDVGYDLYPTNDYDRICLANETWSGFDPTCERKFVMGYVEVEVTIVPIKGCCMLLFTVSRVLQI